MKMALCPQRLYTATWRTTRVMLKMSNVCFIFLFSRKCDGIKNIFEEKCWLTKIGRECFWMFGVCVYRAMVTCCFWWVVWFLRLFFYIPICKFWFVCHCPEICVGKCWMICDNKEEICNGLWPRVSGMMGEWQRTTWKLVPQEIKRSTDTRKSGKIRNCNYPPQMCPLLWNEQTS